MCVITVRDLTGYGKAGGAGACQGFRSALDTPPVAVLRWPAPKGGTQGERGRQVPPFGWSSLARRLPPTSR